MKRISLLVGGALALFAVTASAVDHQVIARNGPRVFDPATLEVNVGDTVTFINDPDNLGFHNVKSDDDAITQFRCARGCDGDGAGGNGDPNGSAWSATVTFDTAGTIGYYCEIHGGDGGVGMSGVITVVGGGGGTPVVGVDPATLAGTATQGASTTVPMTVGNTGDATLDWTADTASTDCTTPDAVPWLSVAPASGSVAAGEAAESVTVTLDATTLFKGIYTANVCIGSNDTANPLVAVPVTFTVTVDDRIFGDGFDPAP
jgi:plastocyanin